jgi:hypothetical protein
MINHTQTVSGKVGLTLSIRGNGDNCPQARPWNTTSPQPQPRTLVESTQATSDTLRLMYTTASMVNATRNMKMIFRLRKVSGTPFLNIKFPLTRQLSLEKISDSGPYRQGFYISYLSSPNITDKTPSLKLDLYDQALSSRLRFLVVRSAVQNGLLGWSLVNEFVRSCYGLAQLVGISYFPSYKNLVPKVPDKQVSLRVQLSDDGPSATCVAVAQGIKGQCHLASLLSDWCVVRCVWSQMVGLSLIKIQIQRSKTSGSLIRGGSSAMCSSRDQ